MKYLIFTLTLLCFATSAFSQDSVKIRTEIDTFKQSNYEGQFDYAFSRKEPRKQLFKLGGMINSNNSYFELAYERKITKDISINSSLIHTVHGNLIGNILHKVNSAYGSSPMSSVLKFSIEPRWYYTMKKDIKSGLISDNLNGNYLGLRSNFDISRKSYVFYSSHELTWGMQRRILKNQYFDVNVGAGISYPSNYGRNDPINGIFNYHFTYGFILDDNVFKKGKAPNCDALRCFEEEKNLWKIGINNAFYATNENIATNLSIANEYKINNSQWSVETKLSFIANKTELSWINYKTYGIGMQVMPRLYWNLNKRIAKGESANNLSGKYIGVISSYNILKTNYNVQTLAETEHIDKTLAIVPVIGFQKRLLNHLFFDMNAGYGAIRRDYFVGGRKSSLSGWRSGFSADFTFGLSF